MAKTKRLYEYGNLPISKLYDLRNKDIALRDLNAMMLNRIGQAFKWEGLPETIPQYMLERYLLRNGSCVVAHAKDNLYAFIGGYGGEPDAYYRPTQYVVANPYLNFNKTLNIDEDCVLVRNDHNMYGIMPILNKYGTLLIENELSLYISDIMTRMLSVFTAGDDNDKKAAELFLSDIENGKLGAITTRNFMQSLTVQPFVGGSSTGLMGQLIEYEQYLKASLYNELGLDANYNMKRESLTMTESQMNDDALYPLIDDMLQCRQEAAEKINELFGTDISVQKNSTWATLDIERDTAEENMEEIGEEDVKEEAEEAEEEVKEDETD